MPPQIIVCGLGQMGYRVTLLLRRLGAEVCVVTMSGREEFLQRCQDAGARIVIGDARTDKNLITAGIREAIALIAVADSDITNIEAALDAKRLNPSVRTVIRLFDQGLAKRLEESIGIDKVWAMSVISAPAFASAAFGEDVRGAFRWGERSYVVGELNTDVFEMEALLEAGDEHTSVTQHIGVGRVELVCEQRSFAKFAGIEHVIRKRTFWTSTLALLNPLTPIRGLRSIWTSTPIQLRSVALLIVALTTLSVFVFQYGMHLSFLDAVYFVTTTVTTTGYGDITPKDAGVLLKIYGCLLMLLGSASIATLYSIITDYIVTTRFDQLFGRQEITASAHVIVAGIGNVGIRTVHELRRMGVNVVAVDLDANSRYRSLLDRDTPFIGGDAREINTLRRAGIENATAIIAVSNDDSVNLSIGLTAKSLNQSARSVVRLFDADFAGKVHGKLNIDTALSASKVAAPSFVGAAFFPDALFYYIRSNRFCVLGKDMPNVGDGWTVEQMVTSKRGSLQLVVKELAEESP